MRIEICVLCSASDQTFNESPPLNSELKEIIHRLSGYLAVFIVFWAIGGVFLFLLGYKESFFELNQFHISFLDIIMPHYTHLGHGALVSLLFILLVPRLDLEIAFALIISLILVAVFVNLGKFYWFEDWDRPLAIFKKRTIHFISLTPNYYHAFPSGHSAVAATAFFFIAAYSGKAKPLYGIFWALVAVSACYSRLYIGVHFLGDIVAGSFMGVGLSLGGYYFVRRTWGKRLRNLPDSSENNIRKWLKIITLILLAFDLYVLLNQNYL